MLTLPALLIAVLWSAVCHVACEIQAALAAFGRFVLSTSPLRVVNATSISVYGLTFGGANGHCVLIPTYLRFISAPSLRSTASSIR